MLMAAEEPLRDLPRTEDSRRLVLEWLDRIEGIHTVERTGEMDKDVSGEELAENGSTASRGGSASDRNGSTAPRGETPVARKGRQPYVVDHQRTKTKVYIGASGGKIRDHRGLIQRR